ncbi:MAG: hypothetical protein ACI4GE_01935 [Lachnospiraceae bacterium]
MAKCQLCGGKIRNGRCSLCGWINQDKKEYLLNKSRCDDKPLTHVHQEENFGSFQKTEKKTKTAKTSSVQKKTASYNQRKTPKTSGRQKASKQKKKTPVWLKMIFIIIGISVFSDLLAAVIRWIEEIVSLFL